MLDEILVVSVCADDAFAAAFLRTVVDDWSAFDETEMRNRDDAALVGDDIFHAEFAESGGDFGASW